MSSAASNGHRLRIADPNRSDGSAPTAFGSGGGNPPNSHCQSPAAYSAIQPPVFGWRSSCHTSCRQTTSGFNSSSHVTISCRRSSHRRLTSESTLSCTTRNMTPVMPTECTLRARSDEPNREPTIRSAQCPERRLRAAGLSRTGTTTDAPAPATRRRAGRS
jgi:hypothetical protein